MDIIEIDHLRLRCIIGFSPHERKDRQDVVISLRIGSDMRLAGQNDRPEHALNYRSITKAIIQHVENSEYYLLEKLAGEIARICVVEHGASYVKVRAHKPGALRFSDSVGVVIERAAADFEEPLVYVSLGSNIDPEKNLIAAINLLRRHTMVLATSPVYRTPPQGYTTQADFLNMAVKCLSNLSPTAFKTTVLDRIETELKRVRDPHNKNAPRTIDLDISLWNDEIFEYGEKPWRVPDENIPRFAHVALPLAELAPDYIYQGKTLRAIAAGFETGDIHVVGEIDDLRV